MKKINWPRVWQQRRGLNYLLLPLAWLYALINTIHRGLYGCGWRSRYQSPRPVVVVGNIHAGGAGKTPLVIGLGRLLKDNQIQVAVISRGYGGDYRRQCAAHLVQTTDEATWVGDEAWLIHHRLQCPVIVGQTRQAAIELALKKHPEIQVFLSDDGLQHYRLLPDLTVCVIPYPDGLGNGWRLPAGPLREAPSRLKSMDFVVSNGGASERYHYQLAENGWLHLATGQRKYPDEFSANAEQNLAIAGIANPQKFFDRVTAQGIMAKTQSLPDHVDYRHITLPADKTLLMTEKDWVKLRHAPYPDAWFLSVSAVLSEALAADFLRAVQALMPKTAENFAKNTPVMDSKDEANQISQTNHDTN